MRESVKLLDIRGALFPQGTQCLMDLMLASQQKPIGFHKIEANPISVIKSQTAL